MINYILGLFSRNERTAHALPKMKIENDQIDMKTQKLAEDVSFRKKDYEDLTL